jgi:hypothetical protein
VNCDGSFVCVSDPCFTSPSRRPYGLRSHVYFANFTDGHQTQPDERPLLCASLLYAGSSTGREAISTKTSSQEAPHAR